MVRINPEEVENVPAEQVDELHGIWFATCVAEEAQDVHRNPSQEYSDKFGIRRSIARHGYETTRKAILALPLSKEHDGSRHKGPDGVNPLIRRSVGDLLRDAEELAGYWDHVK
jgi:hypothetical protein